MDDGWYDRADAQQRVAWEDAQKVALKDAQARLPVGTVVRERPHEVRCLPRGEGVVTGHKNIVAAQSPGRGGLRYVRVGAGPWVTWPGSPGRREQRLLGREKLLERA